MSNIAEGFGRGDDKDFIQFPSTAKGSPSEVQAQQYVALMQTISTMKSSKNLYALAQSTGNMIGGLILYLAKSDNKGFKYETR